jgi:hypothetical protein
MFCQEHIARVVMRHVCSDAGICNFARYIRHCDTCPHTWKKENVHHHSQLLQARNPAADSVHISPQAARGDVSAPMPTALSVLSNFSLAVLADSGWYAVNFSAAEKLEYGRGQSLSFLQHDQPTQVCHMHFFQEFCTHVATCIQKMSSRHACLQASLLPTRSLAKYCSWSTFFGEKSKDVSVFLGSSPTKRNPKRFKIISATTVCVGG